MTMNNDEHSTEDDDERSMSPSGNNSQAEKLRKISHSEIERRRREKMNRYIDEIAQLLPIDAVKKLDKLTVLRVAVDTIKQLKGSTSNVSSTFFGKQIYLTDHDLFELTLATIDQLGNFFFLIVECEKGRICYASNSVESTLGYKPAEICSQIFFDLVHPDDLDVVRQQFYSERVVSSTNTDESSNDGKIFPRLNSKKTFLEVGRRRTFSSRIRTKTKRNFVVSTPQTNFSPVDFVGYLKEFSLTADPSSVERRRTTNSSLTSADVFASIGTNPVTCFLTMANLPKRFDVENEEKRSVDRMFIWKLNSDGQFTYSDQISFALLGYLSHELLGMNFIDFIHEDDRSKLTDIWLRVCRDRQIVTSGFYRFRSKENLYVTFQTIFEPFVHPWSDDLEIIVARNKIENRSTRTSVSTNETPQSVDIQTPNLMDSNELIHHLLP